MSDAQQPVRSTPRVRHGHTPLTDAEEQLQREAYERWRECGWPAFAVDFSFARRMELELSENERWMREVLTDFKIPFDDHKVGMRIALTKWMHDRLPPNA